MIRLIYHALLLQLGVERQSPSSSSSLHWSPPPNALPSPMPVEMVNGDSTTRDNNFHHTFRRARIKGVYGTRPRHRYHHGRPSRPFNAGLASSTSHVFNAHLDL
jgi:hypothetical protein